MEKIGFIRHLQKMSLLYVDANRSKYWVSTFGNVIRYIKERNAVSLTVLAKSLKKIKLEFTDSLENSIFNFPLTIRRPLPKDGKVQEFNKEL
jgi:oligosaccharide reducing-end xylanase